MVLRTSSSDSRSNLRWNAWNLLLLIPLVWLVTPLYNKTGPDFIGMPFFYWFLLAGIPVAAICTSIVYLKTKDEPVVPAPPDLLSVDDLDEGGVTT
jgi:uncharacterized membrane protein YhdT